MVFLWLPGCGSVRYTEPVQSERKMSPADRNYENLWQATLYVLRKYDFTIDRQDRRAGVITTEPLTGKHFFEFWRHDATTSSDKYENTVQTIYRSVCVNLTRSESHADQYTPRVMVTVARSNRGETNIISLSDAYGTGFTSVKSAAEREHYKDKQTEGMKAAVKESVRVGQPLQPVLPAWMTPLGEDKPFAEKLQARITESAMKRTYMRQLELAWPKPLW